MDSRKLWALVKGEGAFLGEFISFEDGVATTTSLGVEIVAGDAILDIMFEDRIVP